VTILLLFLAALTWRDAQRQPPGWYASAEAVRIADNPLLYQRDIGGWDKNLDMAKPLTSEERAKLEKEKHDPASLCTIDNDSTYTQMRYLAREYTATGQSRYAAAFRQGFEYLLKAQYPNGGWPQFFPLRNGYWDHITYNDDAMVGVVVVARVAQIFVAEDGARVLERELAAGGAVVLVDHRLDVGEHQIVVDGLLVARERLVVGVGIEAVFEQPHLHGRAGGPGRAGIAGVAVG